MNGNIFFISNISSHDMLDKWINIDDHLSIGGEIESSWDQVSNLINNTILESSKFQHNNLIDHKESIL